MSTAVSQNGPYQPGQGLLHRVDPRVKVLSCLLLVILTFAAIDWFQLAVLGSTLAIAIWLSAPPFNSIWRLCWMLRWLLLLTLLMHVLLSPGRTLWGTTWLSLDGFLTGIFICLQMLMAVMTSAALATTTSAENLARAFSWYVKPFERLGFSTGEWQKLLLLAMDFLPVIKEELHASSSGDEQNVQDASSPAKLGRWHRWQQRLNELLLRLIDRGDVLAHRLAGEDSSNRPADLAPLLPLSFADQAISVSMMVVIFCYRLLG